MLAHYDISTRRGNGSATVYALLFGACEEGEGAYEWVMGNWGRAG